MLAPMLDFAVADAEWLGHELDQPMRKSAAPAEPATSGASTANSSPPNRAKVSLSRMAGRSRLATMRSN